MDALWALVDEHSGMLIQGVLGVVILIVFIAVLDGGNGSSANNQRNGPDGG